MSKLDTQKVIDYLKGKWQENPCPMCGARAWNVSDSVQELREFQGQGFTIGGSIVPVIPVTCDNCGNTVLVNAIVIGAVKVKKTGSDK